MMIKGIGVQELNMAVTRLSIDCITTSMTR